MLSSTVFVKASSLGLTNSIMIDQLEPSLLLVVGPGAPSSVLAPSCRARSHTNKTSCRQKDELPSKHFLTPPRQRQHTPASQAGLPCTCSNGVSLKAEKTSRASHKE